MDDADDVLISVEERHAHNMLCGSKSVELRRKKPNLAAGTRVWIYSKLPRGQVQLFATVQDVVTDTPDKIWSIFHGRCAISREEFDLYFANSEYATGIVFEKVEPLAPILDLQSIRQKATNFQPPQFFKRLTKDHPELGFFQSAVVG